MSSAPYLKKSGEAVFQDAFHTRASSLVAPWDGSPVQGVGLIGAPLSKSSISLSGAALAPAAMRRALSYFSAWAVEEGIDLKRARLTDFGDILMHATDIVESQRRIGETVGSVLADNPEVMPIVLGGDHSVSAGAIAAFAKAKGRVAVVQFDAHHDVRNLEDGGPTNGTPFRTLIETGVLRDGCLLQVGIRNYANSPVYTDYVKAHGGTILTMRAVRAGNAATRIAEWVESIRSHVDAVYVSLDMDVLDQAFAPGCPAIGPGGMDSATLLECISTLAAMPAVKGLDIVEIDPTLDIRDMTSRVAAHVILNFLREKTRMAVGGMPMG